ncbi:uncharacterized protein KY384_007964 [Bacidia gigantensis]|uniref:uncharacterized protein n=1 Tax=Bacidia gigantensis TaxID=2732470 RepID=UPI001D037359|nr:uncharacterized protein KY384_007964 [Bacidia gigantensis]KAG8527810.1 hypothetical protein KY384_007964 [Bacidia gigantensis]
MSDHVASASSIVSQALSNLPLIQVFGASHRLEKKLTTILCDVQTEGLKKAAVAATQFGTMFLIAYSGNAIAFWQGSKEIADTVDGRGAGVTVGSIYTVIFLLLDGTFRFLMRLPSTNTAASARSLEKVLKRQSNINGTSRSSGTSPQAIVGSISLDAVTFAYPSRPEVDVLKSASMNFPAGKHSAIVGVSGSGKSTLAALVTRLYDPHQGKVLIDGQDIREMNVRYLRSYVGLVSQEPTLLNRSILENIALGLVSSVNHDFEAALLDSKLNVFTQEVRKGQDFEAALQNQSLSVRTIVDKVRSAADLADADLFIKGLEHGYATCIGSKGNELSGGQKQRIALARALVKDPVILIMDEATSALDSKTEQNIQSSLDGMRKSRTTITVAHRLATVKDAENIIVMRDGQVIEQGSHQDLLASGGAYATLTDTQSLQLTGLVSPNMSDESSETLVPIGSGAEVVPDDIGDEKQELTKPSVVEANGQSDTAHVDKERYILQTIRTYTRLARPQLLIIFVGLIGAIVAGGSYSSEAVIFGTVVGRLNPCEGSSSIRATGNLFGLLFFVLGLAEFFANVVAGSAFGRVAEKMVFKVRILTFRSLFHQDITWHNSEGRTPSSLLSHFTSDTNALAGLSGTIVGTILTILVNLIASILLTHIVAWKIAIVLLATLPILLGSGVMRLRALAKFQDRHQAVYATSIGITVEAVESIKTIATLSLEEEFYNTYKRSLAGPYKASFREIAYTNFWLATAYSVSNLIYALAYWWGSKQILNGNYTQTQFFIVLPALLFSAQSCGQMFALAPDVSNAAMAAQRLVKIMKIGPTRPDTSSALSLPSDLSEKIDSGDLEANSQATTPYPTPPNTHGSSIKIRNLSFHYPHNPNHPILHDLNLDIPSGSYCALVGPSGGGKSTIISLLSALYAPTSGTIAIDNHAFPSPSPLLLHLHLHIRLPLHPLPRPPNQHPLQRQRSLQHLPRRPTRPGRQQLRNPQRRSPREHPRADHVAAGRV